MKEKQILNKIRRFCAAVGFIGIVLIIVAYTKQMITLGIFACEMTGMAALTEAISNPIEEEEEEYE